VIRSPTDTVARLPQRRDGRSLGAEELKKLEPDWAPVTTFRMNTAKAARRGHLLRVLREVGVVGSTEATREAAVQFRETLEELGATFVKLGQLLSSRPDLLPDVCIEELGKLVDDVPPVPFPEIREVVARELGLERFTSIDETPLASASIGQIHRALLDSGQDVVVKVRRPGVVEQVEVDLALRRKTARIAEGRSDTAKLLQLRAVVDELDQHLHAELDFIEEAHNAELIAQVTTSSGTTCSSRASSTPTLRLRCLCSSVLKE